MRNSLLTLEPLRWWLSDAVCVHISNEKSTCALASAWVPNNSPAQHSTQCVCVTELLYGLRGCMEMPYPRMLSAGHVILFSVSGVLMHCITIYDVQATQEHVLLQKPYDL